MVCEAIKEEKEEKLYVFYEMKNSIIIAFARQYNCQQQQQYPTNYGKSKRTDITSKMLSESLLFFLKMP